MSDEIESSVSAAEAVTGDDGPGLDPRAGDVPQEMSEEMVVLVQLFREVVADLQVLFQQQNEMLSGQLARMNAWLDRLHFAITTGNAALEAMMGPVQRADYAASVESLKRQRQEQLAQIRQKLGLSPGQQLVGTPASRGQSGQPVE